VSTGLRLTARAPAKVNLSLKVTGRRADGYHLIDSRVVFAGVGDELSLDPLQPLALTISGPFGAGLAAEPDNLILKAARLFAETMPGARAGGFHLVKRLPVASGIGGGTADGAAAIRLLARLNDIPLVDPRLHEVAARLGADGPVCLASRGRMMGGIGEVLGPMLPALNAFAVLVNPGVGVATPAVFAALGLRVGETRAAEAADWIAAGNDLEAPAIQLAPVIADVLAALRGTDGVQLARMSGSGATCFGLYRDCRASAEAARLIRRAHPGWWVKPTLLR
jgi:4-diphosphocytidyl-2-C-methyl-D-erythritol kinase